MSWFRSSLHSISISDWLTAAPAPAADPSEALEHAREAMMQALGEQGRCKRASLALRIASAKDAESLWALRPELMTAACQFHGEAEARRRLQRVTACFGDLLPQARLTGPALGRRMAA